MLTFKPAIWREGVLYQLPRPVRSLRMQDSWDFAQFKVPLADGDAIEGRSQNGVDIAIEGECGTQAGTLLADEAGMFGELEALRTALGVSTPEDAYELFLYHDAVAGTYRSFRECSTVRFDYDLSEPRLFTYSILIHADNPQVFDEAPT
jgi:hypothetical protein